MASTYGKNLKVTLTGTSHGPKITIDIKGLPVGMKIADTELVDLLSRRKAKGNLATPRHELDEVVWEEGISCENGILTVTGPKITGAVYNNNTRGSDYSRFRDVPRPGHADYTAIMKDGDRVEIEGGGRFSGRMTVGLCIAGGICKEILKTKGISVKAKVVEIGGSRNPEEFASIVLQAKEEQDSVGGIVNVTVTGLQPGSCGDTYFDGLESRISEAVFGVPAVKGVSFGSGFHGARLRGSENNDAFYFDSEMEVRTRTNNHGGILGGIASGMPVTLNVAVKPTPSIGRPQESVNLSTNESEILEVGGRHDPCIALRIPPVLESVVSMAVLDSLMEADPYEVKDLNSLRKKIDTENSIILDSFERRLDYAKDIALIKYRENLPAHNEKRVQQILERIRESAREENADEAVELFRKIIELTTSLEEKLMDAEEEKKVYGLIGNKISKSRSPRIHKRIGELLGREYPYELFEMETYDEVKDFILEGDFGGLNITMPYKRDVIPYLDGMTDLAKEIGAVNTIYRRNGKLLGDNTDCYGVIHSFRSKGVDVNGKNCLILGTGGASDSVYYALKSMGANRIVRLTHSDLDSGKAYNYLDYDIIVNATPYGSYETAGDSLIDLNSFVNCRFVMDLIYTPVRTKLLQDAKLLGIKYIGGTDMLVAQAVKAYEDFLDVDLSNTRRESVIADIKNMLLKDENIILVGMPGSGKTTVGKKLAELLHKDFYDTDEMIEYREGKSPKDIINEMGEPAFREKERETCMVLSQVKNAVIATGGGIVLQDDNFYSLTNNGTVVLLKRDLEKLDRTGRPLSTDLLKLYTKRAPLYDTWKDIEVDGEGKTIDEIAKEITERLEI